MNNEEKMFDLLEKIYIELQDSKTEMSMELQETKTELKAEIKDLREKIIFIEQDHGKKLDRIEK